MVNKKSVSALVAFDYEAEQPDELTLAAGMVITNVVQHVGGWWEGEINGKRGMFPENFVELLDEGAPSNSSSTGAASSSGSLRKADAKTMRKVKVTFEYQPEQDDEIALAVGEVLDILEDEDEGWWKGRKADGELGVFPSNFVEVIHEEEEKALPPALLPEPIQPQKPTEPEPAPSTVTPSQPQGFGLSLGDLSKNKLKKTGKADFNKEDQKPVLPSPSKTPTSEGAPPMVEKTTRMVKKGTVTFAYKPEQPDELELQVGDVVSITNDNVFDGWLEGTLNGKKGLFPDNFVTISEEEIAEVDYHAPAKSKQNSLVRSAKQTPSEDVEKPPSPVAAKPPSPMVEKAPTPVVEKATEEKPVEVPKEPENKPKPHHGGRSMFPPGGMDIKQELEKRLSMSQTKPGEIKKSKLPPPPVNKKPKPALPSLPKPKPLKPTVPKATVPLPVAKQPVADLAKVETPSPKASPLTSKAPSLKAPALSATTKAVPPSTAKSTPPSTAKVTPPSTVKTQLADTPPQQAVFKEIPTLLPEAPASPVASAPSSNNPSARQPSIKLTDADPLAESSKPLENGRKESLDLDTVKPTDPLKHIQRVKAPGKNPPSKYRLSTIETTNTTSEEVAELRNQVSQLTSKMSEMEKLFKKLMKQVTNDLDEERKTTLNQQVEIERLKKQMSLLISNDD